MTFNSLHFLLFFPVVCLLFWCLPHKWRNPMLLIASYYFYMNWEPVYAILIAFCSISTWIIGNRIESSESGKKLWLTVGIVVNLSVLFVYKYLNFTVSSIFSMLELCGIRMQVPDFKLLLPVGISFYTFQALGYTIDVYRGNVKAEKCLFTYA